MTSTLKTQR